jgi:hypothetical protein
MEPRGNADRVGKVTSYCHSHTKTLESPDQLEPCVPSLYPPRSRMSHESGDRGSGDFVIRKGLASFVSLHLQLRCGVRMMNVMSIHPHLPSLTGHQTRLFPL